MEYSREKRRCEQFARAAVKTEEKSSEPQPLGLRPHPRTYTHAAQPAAGHQPARVRGRPVCRSVHAEPRPTNQSIRPAISERSERRPMHAIRT